MFLIFQCYH